MNKIIFVSISIFFSFPVYADMNDANKSKAWDCSGIYMANYFLPAGETFEYSMKEKSVASVKVLKAFALEAGIAETNWDEGVNKAVDKYYGSKYDKAKTDECHAFLEGLIPNGKERVNKVIQTLY
ncbi:hypothetical protein N8Z07_04110 [Pelagibacteraceae bacterium]|nr:hypothetical protein [Pelagibacteraceae bacterium]